MSNSNYVTDAVPDPPRTGLGNGFASGIREDKYEEKCEFEEKPRKRSNAEWFWKAPKDFNVAVINSMNTHVGNVTIINNSKTDEKVENPPKLSDEVIKLLNCSQAVTIEDVNAIKKVIGKNHKEFFRLLGYKDGYVEQYEITHNRNFTEMIYTILRNWIRQNTQAATIAVLTKALWSAKEYDAIEELSNHFQKRQTV